MSKLKLGTNLVLNDEPCLGLREMNSQPPDNSGIHRYRTITVIRNGQEVEYREDLGLSSQFKVDQFIIPGGRRPQKDSMGFIVHTVGELRDIADQLKDKKLWDKKELAQNNNIREKF